MWEGKGKGGGGCSYKKHLVPSNTVNSGGSRSLGKEGGGGVSGLDLRALLAFLPSVISSF